jgi:hypothetical protein
MLILQNEKTEIPLRTASSGLQSVIPLFVIAMSIIIRGNKKTLSITEQEYYDALLKKYGIQNSRELAKLDGNRRFYNSANLIIEEPEQNLFPATQRDLLYFLMEICASAPVVEHSLTITTHSPYILYAVNNCMMGGLLGNKIKESDKEKLNCSKSFINPQNISIYEIHSGVLKQIQQNDGLISANYFDANMKELMNDFYVMLNYYGV